MELNRNSLPLPCREPCIFFLIPSRDPPPLSQSQCLEDHRHWDGEGKGWAVKETTGKRREKGQGKARAPIEVRGTRLTLPPAKGKTDRTVRREGREREAHGQKHSRDGERQNRTDQLTTFPATTIHSSVTEIFGGVKVIN